VFSRFKAVESRQSNSFFFTASAFRQYAFRQTIIRSGLILTFNYTGLNYYEGLAPGFQGIPGATYW